jgi:HAMP domain-containing protein
MAFRSGSGRLGFPQIRLPKLGLRGSLFSAFAVIAGIAILISAGACMALGHIGGTIVDLSQRQIPRLAASLGLSAQSATLASQGPAVLTSQNPETLAERSRKMKETQQVTLQRLAEITELGADKSVIAALGETIKSIDDATQSLASASRERLEVVALHDRQYDALRSAQSSFVAASSPLMLDAQVRLNAILGSAVAAPDDVTEAARAVEQLGNVIASGNLASSLMATALSANSSDTLDTIETDFKATAAQVKSGLDLLPKTQGWATLKDAVLKLLGLGLGKTGVFNLREKELDANDYGQTVLEETRKLNVGLDISIQQLVEGVRKGATAMASEEIGSATWIMLGVGLLTLIGSALYVWRYICGNILRRSGALKQSMQMLSNGDLDAEIDRSSYHDEIAAMAEALEVFRESMIRAAP